MTLLPNLFSIRLAKFLVLVRVALGRSRSLTVGIEIGLGRERE